MPEVLGSEWGPLAGLTKDDALKTLVQYVQTLETSKATNESPAAVAAKSLDFEKLKSGTEEEATEEMKRFVKSLHDTSLMPAVTQFVAQRESAKQQAKAAIVKQGLDWDRYESFVEQGMANAAPEQQTTPQAWYDAWWYVEMLDRRQKLLSPPKPAERTEEESDLTNPPRSEERESVSEDELARYLPAVTSRVVPGPMASERSIRRSTPEPSNPYRVDDPDEVDTKRKFERLLGLRISDEEWVRLRDEVRTEEDYKALQADLAAKAKKRAARA